MRKLYGGNFIFSVLITTGTLMLSKIEEKLRLGQRLSNEEGLYLYEEAPLEWLQREANAIKQNRFGREVYYNRNIHFEPTNKCIYACKFCAFYRPPRATEAEGAWDYSLADLEKILDRYPEGGITEIHITGGVHPDRGVEYGEALIQKIKTMQPRLHVKAFTAVEIDFFSKRSGITLEETLKRLKAAGLDSLPGGGAEIFDPAIRKIIAGGKAPAHRWLEVHEAAHRTGLGSNATMLYGHVEKYGHRVEHMHTLRTLQDRTGGFNAFIPLKYRNENNALSELPELGEAEDLRNFAVARLFMDNIPHLKAYWVMLGIPRAVKALSYGVDDLDGTVDDSTKIYSMAGSMQNPALTSDALEKLITDNGGIPVERDSVYDRV